MKKISLLLTAFTVFAATQIQAATYDPFSVHHSAGHSRSGASIPAPVVGGSVPVVSPFVAPSTSFGVKASATALKDAAEFRVWAETDAKSLEHFVANDTNLMDDYTAYVLGGLRATLMQQVTAGQKTAEAAKEEMIQKHLAFLGSILRNPGLEIIADPAGGTAAAALVWLRAQGAGVLAQLNKAASGGFVSPATKEAKLHEFAAGYVVHLPNLNKIANPDYLLEMLKNDATARTNFGL